MSSVADTVPPFRDSIVPSRDEFRTLAKQANLVPLILELVADVQTPVSAFARIGEEGPCFLFESAEKNDESGRFSYLGLDPLFMINSDEVEGDPLRALEERMSQYRVAAPEGTSVFAGAVGYIGYDAVPFFEPKVKLHPQDDLHLPRVIFMVPRTLLIFDHRFRKLKLVRLELIDEEESADTAFDRAQAALHSLLSRLEEDASLPAIAAKKIEFPAEISGNTTRDEFEAMVKRARELIAAGDIFQVVLSQRFETDFTGRTLDLYRALRFGNPSPYMFCLQFGKGFSIVGSSPEVHLRVRQGTAELRPIAGTYRRGTDTIEDEQLARELVRDPKERAEHVMLIDLGRNDLGRVAQFGTVNVTEQMTIERYSHVMHIVSHIVAKLREECTAFDAMRATFPAGTVSGAPKVRAMEIIGQLEKARRGFYAGIVGLFGFDGDHDSCIAIRSILLKNGKAYIQTGAGIVADSDPAREYDECVNKARAMLEAIARAKQV